MSDTYESFLESLYELFPPRYEGRWHVDPAEYLAADRKHGPNGVEFSLLAKEVHGTFVGGDEETGKKAILAVTFHDSKFVITKTDH